jgi:hypothetical protein
METKKPRGAASFDLETRARVARLGGLALSRNRAHMSALGKIGGKVVSADRAHMARIGKLGALGLAQARAARKEGQAYEETRKEEKKRCADAVFRIIIMALGQDLIDLAPA